MYKLKKFWCKAARRRRLLTRAIASYPQAYMKVGRLGNLFLRARAFKNNNNTVLPLMVIMMALMMMTMAMAVVMAAVMVVVMMLMLR